MKILVSYFSAGGATRKVASKLASLLKADLEEIIPESRYTSADLDWRNDHSRSSLEMNDEKSRPEIKTLFFELSAYDVIFVGYPIWWYVEPRVIDTYLDSFHLEGKRIIPFATSGGSSIDGSVAHLRKLYPTAKIEDGLLLNHGVDEKAIRKAIGEKIE